MIAAKLQNTVTQGEEDTAIVDCGDNADVDVNAGPLDRLVLGPGESVTAVSLSIKEKPNKLDGNPADDPTLGTPVVIEEPTECNDRIIEEGEGFTFAYAFADDAAVGKYKIECEIETDLGATKVVTLTFIVSDC